MVARFSSVSVIASGLVKLPFNSVMTAWRSGEPNELTKSSVVGLPEGEGDASADGLAEAAPIAHFLIARKFEFRISNLEFSQLVTLRAMSCR